MKRKLFWGANLSALTLALSVAGGLGLSSAGVSAHNNDGGGTHSSRHKLEHKLSARFSDDQADCMVTAQQVAELDAFFNVKTFDVEVNGQDTTVAAVKARGLTRAQLRDYLEANNEGDLDCSITRYKGVFYLPVQPSA
jgi:hypothetical protein